MRTQQEIKKKAQLICAQLGEKAMSIAEAWQNFHEIDHLLTPALRREVATFIIEREESLIQGDHHYPPHAED